MLKRIIFVDDETQILKSITRLFMDTEYEVITVESGAEALDSKYNITITEDKGKDYIVVLENLTEAYKSGKKAEVDNIEMYEKF